LYPAINLQEYDHSISLSDEALGVPSDRSILLSINRFERKKNIALAIEAFAILKQRLEDATFEKLQLVLAGGYDPRLRENIDYVEELKKLAQQLGVDQQVSFKLSFTEEERSILLSRCLFLLYTPEGEHFGIVPVETMYASRPVIAVNSGGPLESILDGQTGFLCEPNPEAFATAMRKLLVNPELREQMGASGRKRVKEKFSLQSFSDFLDHVISEMVQ